MKRLIFATMALFMALPASAEFIESHVNNDGDALATLDTTTGLEWLDLTVTDGNSINQALSRTNVGGDLEGWRLPTYEEMKGLANALYPKLNTSTENTIGTATTTERNRHQSLFGRTASVYTYGQYVRPDDNRVYLFGVNGVRSVFFNYYRGPDWDYSISYDGIYLVSDGGTTYSSINNDNWNVAEGATDVPLPVGIGLFSLGLFALTRRKSKQGVTL